MRRTLPDVECWCASPKCVYTVHMHECNCHHQFQKTRRYYDPATTIARHNHLLRSPAPSFYCHPAPSFSENGDHLLYDYAITIICLTTHHMPIVTQHHHSAPSFSENGDRLFYDPATTIARHNNFFRSPAPSFYRHPAPSFSEKRRSPIL